MSDVTLPFILSFSDVIRCIFSWEHNVCACILHHNKYNTYVLARSKSCMRTSSTYNSIL